MNKSSFINELKVSINEYKAKKMIEIKQKIEEYANRACDKELFELYLQSKRSIEFIIDEIKANKIKPLLEYPFSEEKRELSQTDYEELANIEIELAKLNFENLFVDKVCKTTPIFLRLSVYKRVEEMLEEMLRNRSSTSELTDFTK